MIQNGIYLAGKISVALVKGCLAGGEARNRVFEAVSGCFPGSVLGHGNGSGGRSDHLLRARERERDYSGSLVRGRDLLKFLNLLVLIIS